MIIQYPVLTEKAVGMIEKENKLVFVVDKKATKQQIAAEVEKLYSVKVAKVNVVNTMKGVKRAYIKLTPAFNAADLATKLKII